LLLLGLCICIQEKIGYVPINCQWFDGSADSLLPGRTALRATDIPGIFMPVPGLLIYYCRNARPPQDGIEQCFYSQVRGIRPAAASRRSSNRLCNPVLRSLNR
jgi:hypothetical protein